MFSKNVSKKSLIHSQKKGVVCSVHATINISWKFSASSHHSQRTHLYMYLPEQYNRQNNSIASSQRFSVHVFFVSNYSLNGGPIFCTVYIFIFFYKHYRTSSWCKGSLVFCALVNTVSIGDATTVIREDLNYWWTKGRQQITTFSKTKWTPTISMSTCFNTAQQSEFILK